MLVLNMQIGCSVSKKSTSFSSIYLIFRPKLCSKESFDNNESLAKVLVKVKFL